MGKSETLSVGYADTSPGGRGKKEQIAKGTFQIPSVGFADSSPYILKGSQEPHIDIDRFGGEYTTSQTREEIYQ